MSTDRAAAFAEAAVISALTMPDWQISRDVEAAMRSAVDVLPSAPDDLAVTLHRDWIDVSAATRGTSARRRCFPRRPFATAVECRADSTVPDSPALV